MKLNIIKSGKWSKHPAWGPIVDIVEGKNFEDDDDEFCQKLINAGYAKVLGKRIKFKKQI